MWYSQVPKIPPVTSKVLGRREQKLSTRKKDFFPDTNGTVLNSNLYFESQ